MFFFLVTSSLINEELARPAFSYYEVFTTNYAYVELTMIILGFVVRSSLAYEEIAMIMFKSLKSETPNPKPETHLLFNEELALLVLGFLVISSFAYEELARSAFLFTR